MEESTDANYKVWEFKQKEVIFDMNPCRMVIMKDISELVQREYNRSIQKLTEIMVASASHDMRTPLNTIINMHQLIELKTEDETVRSLLQIAKNSTDLLMFLVRDTLDLFQIRSGRFEIKKQPVKITDLVGQCFDLITIPMTQKSLTKVEEIDDCLRDCEFLFDKQRISQVIVNLLSNALKFTTKGFIKLAVTQEKRYPIKKLVRKHKNILQSRVNDGCQNRTNTN